MSGQVLNISIRRFGGQTEALQAQRPKRGLRQADGTGVQIPSLEELQRLTGGVGHRWEAFATA
jgi:hypothetical protein